MKIRKIKKYIYEIVGVKPQLVGSSYVGISIKDSDADFAISCLNEKERMQLHQKMIDSGFDFYGERQASCTTTRLLYSMNILGKDVDINLMLKDDFDLLVSGMRHAKNSLTIKDKLSIKKKKKLLKKCKLEYEQYKLLIYEKFCAGLVWKTDVEICKNLMNQYIEKNSEFPQWLREKKEEYNL